MQNRISSFPMLYVSNGLDLISDFNFFLQTFFFFFLLLIEFRLRRLIRHGAVQDQTKRLIPLQFPYQCITVDVRFCLIRLHTIGA